MDCLTAMLWDLTCVDPGRLPAADAVAWLDAVVDVLAALPWPGERAIWIAYLAGLLTQHDHPSLRRTRRRFFTAVLRERVTQAQVHRPR